MTTTKEILNETVYKNLTELFYEIVSKSYKLFDVEKSKKLLDICGDSDVNVERIYEMAMDYLKKPHSEIRYNTFRVLDTFFTKHRMRYLIVENMKAILDLTTNINYDIPLPPPKKIADELNKFVLKTIKRWASEFGHHYKKLFLCYEFLLQKKHVDFEKLEIEDLATQRRKREEEEKKRKLTEKKLKTLLNEINEQRPEVENLITSLESCLVMLVPTPEQFSINDSFENNQENTNIVASTSNESPIIAGENTGIEVPENADIYRETGMLMGNYSIDINFKKTDKKKIEIRETEDNSIIIENARDHYKLLSKKFLNSIKNWIKNIATLSDNSKEISELIDLKVRVEKIIIKFELLEFKMNTPSLEDDDSSDNSDMEEVVAPVRVVDEELMACYKDDQLAIPSTSGLCRSSINENENFDTNERKKKLLEIAPKLPFDVDLYYWEEENLSTPMLLPKSNDGRNFWSATAVEDTEGIPDPAGTSGLRTRIIEFAGKFEPVKWSCRFPLPNGKLCPRRDRLKCPFHGPVVARDETGKCANAEDAKKDELIATKSTYSEAQDPKLLAEIKRETGLDLTIGKPKRKKKDESGLSSIREEQNTVHRRLERKLFKRSTVKRVARKLDNLDQKRFQDKYGDQFQYIHGTVYDNYKK